MNLLKIQTEILKTNINKKEPSYRVLRLHEESENVLLMTNYYFYIIPFDEFYLDIDVCGHGEISDKTARFFLTGADNTIGDLFKTGDKTVIPNKLTGKDTLTIVLKDSDGNERYVDEKFLSNFDNNCEFKDLGPKKPIYIFEPNSGKIAGAVMEMMKPKDETQ